MKKFKNVSFEDRPFKDWPFWIKREFVNKTLIFLCVGIALPKTKEVAYEGDYIVKSESGDVFVKMGRRGRNERHV